MTKFSAQPFGVHLGMAIGLTIGISSLASAQSPASGPAKTEVWSPVPAVVTPGDQQRAPSDAIVLFGGKDLSEWRSAADAGKPAAWTVADGAFTVAKGTGNIQTTRLFSDYQLHVEWRVPTGLTGSGQGRGNSGVFLASTGNGYEGYELQILDCNANPTYVNGQAASIYKQHAPLVNACAAPGAWQTYDVVWQAPRFKADGALATPAYVTVLHNGVLVQNHAALAGETLYEGAPFYKAHGAAPIKLQDHGDPVSYRNIWVRPLNTGAAKP
jgi:hypothetical protein